MQTDTSISSKYLAGLLTAGKLVEPVDRVPVISELLDWQRIITEAKLLVDAAEEARKIEYEKYQASFAEKKAARAKREEEERQREREKEQAQKERYAAMLDHRENRVLDHGTELLKEGVKRRYNCAKQFLEEWGAKELGSIYVLDLKDKIAYDPRSCPSEQALKELMRLEDLADTDVLTSEVVWLPQGLYPVAGEDWDDHEPCEAVRVTLQNDLYFNSQYVFYRTFRANGG